MDRSLPDVENGVATEEHEHPGHGVESVGIELPVDDADGADDELAAAESDAYQRAQADYRPIVEEVEAP